MKMPIKKSNALCIAVIDCAKPSVWLQEELVGISLALAASADAYATARQNGHPVIGLIVGNAISGGLFGPWLTVKPSRLH